jgi:signal transduction histidine kinase
MSDNIFILFLLTATGLGIIIVGFILLQVRNQNKLLQKQKEIASKEMKHQKALLEAVMISQETERRRIGNDLHDEVGAVLSSLRMLIEKQDFQAASILQNGFINQSKELIDRVIIKVRQISHNLAPQVNGHFWFYDALYELAETVNVSDTIRISLDFGEEEIPESLDSNTSLAMYRVFSELINNTIKHARANLITIRIALIDENMILSYSDDGIGFDQNLFLTTKGVGLRNIESRLDMIGATWNVQQENTNGFSIKISIPLLNS